MSDLEQRALAIPASAMVLMITDRPSYERGAELLLAVKDLRAEVNRTFDPIIHKQYQAHQEAIAQKKRHDAPLMQAEGLLKPRMAAYLRAEEESRRAAEKVLQEAATLQEAVDAEARGDQRSAEAALDGQGIVSVSMPTPPKVAGISRREVWSAEVTDLAALIKAVAAGHAPMALLLPNMSALNQQAKALKASMRYPGVKAVREDVIAAGSRL